MHPLRRDRFSGLALLAALAVVIGACGAGDSGTVPVAPDDPSEINVVVLFDRSGSTGQNGSRLGIERAIWPATFFPNLGNTYSLNVMPIGFSSNAKAWCDWPDLSDSERFLSQDPECKSDIENIITNSVTGGTYFDKALKAASEQLADSGGKKYVLMVTDGEFAQNDGKVICTDEPKDLKDVEPCKELGAALNALNSQRVTFCSVFVSTPSSEETSSATLQWLRERQNQNDSKEAGWSQSDCPASTEIDLESKPWKLAEDIIVWYAEELAGLLVRSTASDARGDSNTPITVPNGAAEVAIIGLKYSTGSSITFQSAGCERDSSTDFDSFYFERISSESTNGERCAGGKITGKGLAPGENSLRAIFVPEKQVLAACVPNPDGGGLLQLQPGFDSLLAFMPRAVWVGPHGETQDPQLRPDQYQDGGLALDEGQASDLQGREKWGIAFDYASSVNPPGNLESYSLLYESTVLKPEAAGGYAARAPIMPTINGLPCAKLFERNSWQKYWLLFLATGALMALLLTRAAYKSQTVDLSGELLVLDSTGTRPITRHTLSGGSPNWFSVGEKMRIESGKSKDGGNWRLVWKKGAALVLQQEVGSTEDWSIGAPKREKGSAVIEFRRVPLSGTSEVQTVRYTPDGGKVEAALERVLDEEAT